MNPGHSTATQPGMAFRSSGDFDLMWREVAHAEQRVWTIAHEPFAGLFTIWEPHCELVEHDDAYQLRATLPGMQRDEVRIECQQGMLVLHGERTMEAARGAVLPRTKYGSQAFTRRFVLSEPVVAEAMVVTSRPDTLEIRIPKATVSTVAPTGSMSHLGSPEAHNDRMAVLAS